MSSLDLDFFKARHKQTFQIALDDDTTYAVELTEVHPKQNMPEGWHGFTLYFEGNTQLVLNQRIHNLTCEDGEAIEVFMVPVEQAGDKFVYESVFNMKINE